MTQKLLGWRKFIFTALVVLASVILLICGILNGDQFVNLNQIIVPAFIAGNLVETWTKRKATNDNPPNIGPTA